MVGVRIGPFEVKQQLGEGGMGRVFLAEHAVLKTARVIKLLLPELTRNATIVQRFINEARAAASIAHRNIIAVHDIGQLPDGNWFIVMDYLEGGTLRRLLQTHGGPLGAHEALRILVQVASGLEAAHHREIIHRDLKPDNIFLTRRDANDRHVVILDFGVAKLAEHRAGGPMTHTGQAIGTPAYMSPEQLRGAVVDRTCDVFALGVIAYQMVTGGYLPFQDTGFPEAFYDLPSAEIYHRQVTTLPIDPRTRVATLAEGWARAILRALDRDRAKRFASARDFAIALAEATTADGYGADGVATIRAYAPELLDIGNLLDTVRSPSPHVPPAVASRYRLGHKLGTGGMAEVFEGTVVGAEGFARRVAIKRVLAGLSDVRQFATMFIQEARIASQLAHPNVVAVLDFDRDPEGRLFLVMEHVDGKDLADVLAGGPLPPAVAIFIATEMLRGLGYAHGMRGVIHRDVSPHNVLLSWEGAVKVSDFGIAKALEASGGAATQQLKGKPAYMSPEQANSEPLDGRSDLFAAGVVLWEMLAGRRLFAGTTKEILAQVLFRDVARPSSVLAVPRDVEEVAMTLLARERADRFATADDAIAALARCADNPRDGRGDLVRMLAGRFPAEARVRSRRPAEQRMAVAIPAVPSTLAHAASQALPSLGPPAAPHRRVLLAGAAAAGALACLALAIVLGLDRRDRGAASPGDAALAVDAVLAQSRAAASADAALGRLELPDAVEPALIGDAPKPPVAIPGTLAIRVDPWAQVTIGRTAYGQTPVRAKLPPGRYRVRLANDARDKLETLDVVVESGRATLIDRNWRE